MTLRAIRLAINKKKKRREIQEGRFTGNDERSRQVKDHIFHKNEILCVCLLDVTNSFFLASSWNAYDLFFSFSPSGTPDLLEGISSEIAWQTFLAMDKAIKPCNRYPWSARRGSPVGKSHPRTPPP